MEKYLKAGSYCSSATTSEQPFPAGVLGCNQFRIPGIITLKNGKVLCCGDARWDDAEHDYGGIDTIISISDDDGKTWNPGFAAMFPDTVGTPDIPQDATTCIDPCLVQDKNGRIHLFVNMNPTGITTGLGWPGVGNGFAFADGKMRLALTDNFEKAATPFYTEGNDFLYVGDYSDGIATVFTCEGKETSYSVDEYFNIFKNGEPVFQKQMYTGVDIQQNLFYRDSDLHVYNTMYTMHAYTDDEGKTWHNSLISDMIKLPSEDALISSPGNGVVTECGTILMPFYTFDDKEYMGFPVIIYSDDNGNTWKRTNPIPKYEGIKYTGENKIVVLSDTLWRVFLRNQNKHIMYADYDRTRSEWSQVTVLDQKIHSDCNLSAIKSGDKIYVSAPAGVGEECRNRSNGKLFVYVLNADNSLTYDKTIDITDKAFSYSCLSVVKDRIFCLYDTCGDGELILKKLEI